MLECAKKDVERKTNKVRRREIMDIELSAFRLVQRECLFLSIYGQVKIEHSM